MARIGGPPSRQGLLQHQYMQLFWTLLSLRQPWKGGDTACELFCFSGMGPVSKWSDDHIFIHILCEHIPLYNSLQEGWHSEITRNGGHLHSGGRYWYCGATMPDGSPKEYDEDSSFPIIDLSQSSPRSPDDAKYSYCLSDIDNLLKTLGIPWEFPFIGFAWNLTSYSVSLPDKKKTKYLEVISLWNSCSLLSLEEVQKLYSKLLHTCLIVPMGHAFLTNLESMLGIFHNSPHKPRTPPRGTEDDLHWWYTLLSQCSISRLIPSPCPLLNLKAYSDASTFGIAITLGPFWRAWRLLPGWQRDNRDIG